MPIHTTLHNHYVAVLTCGSRFQHAKEQAEANGGETEEENSEQCPSERLRPVSGSPQAGQDLVLDGNLEGAVYRGGHIFLVQTKGSEPGSLAKRSRPGPGAGLLAGERDIVRKRISPTRDRCTPDWSRKKERRRMLPVWVVFRRTRETLGLGWLQGDPAIHDGQSCSAFPLGVESHTEYSGTRLCCPCFLNTCICLPRTCRLPAKSSQ